MQETQISQSRISILLMIISSRNISEEFTTWYWIPHWEIVFLEHQDSEGKSTLGILFGVWIKAQILTFPYFYFVI